MQEGKQSLSREQLLSLLDKVGMDLQAQDIIGEIAIYGGTALTLMYDFRQTTFDVDFTAMDPVNNGQYCVSCAAKRVAKNEGMDENWMNDAVETFVSDNPSFDFFGEFPKENPGIRIFTATPEYIFSMKMLSMRSTMVSSDIDDIWNLIDACQIQSMDEAKDRLAKFYPNKKLPVRNELMLKDVFEAKFQGKSFDRTLWW